MGWSYSQNPASSPKDEVRYLIGDTDPDSPFLSDEEIGYALSQASDRAPAAAISALEAIIYRLASKAFDQSLGPASISYSKVLDNFRANLKLLRERSGLNAIKPFGGGIHWGDLPMDREGRLRKRPDFTSDMFKNNPYAKTATRGVEERGPDGYGYVLPLPERR